MYSAQLVPALLVALSFASTVTATPTAVDVNAYELAADLTGRQVRASDNPNACPTAGACLKADAQNDANFLINLGTYVISLGAGETRQVAITNGCKVFASSSQGSSSYARDFGYGVQGIINDCAGNAQFSGGYGTVYGNGNIQLRLCTYC